MTAITQRWGGKWGGGGAGRGGTRENAVVSLLRTRHIREIRGRINHILPFGGEFHVENKTAASVLISRDFGDSRRAWPLLALIFNRIGTVSRSIYLSERFITDQLYLVHVEVSANLKGLKCIFAEENSS